MLRESSQKDYLERTVWPQEKVTVERPEVISGGYGDTMEAVKQNREWRKSEIPKEPIDKCNEEVLMPVQEPSERMPIEVISLALDGTSVDDEVPHVTGLMRAWIDF